MRNCRRRGREAQEMAIVISAILAGDFSLVGGMGKLDVRERCVRRGRGGEEETYVHMPCWRRKKVRSELWMMWTE